MEQKKSGVELIQIERQKQIDKYGYTPEHDSMYSGSQLKFAALSYLNTALYGKSVGEEDWPFDKVYFKPGTEIACLSKAGALIAAEIDRLTQEENDE